MNVKDKLKFWVRDNNTIECKHFIKREQTNVKFNAAVGVEPVSFSLSNVSIEKQQLVEATYMAIVLDDHLYSQCLDYQKRLNSLDVNDPEFTAFLKKRNSIREMILKLQITAHVFHNDIETQKKLEDIMKKMSDEFTKEDFDVSDYNDLQIVGNALRKSGKYEQSLAYFKKALEIKPDHFKSLRNMGLALNKLRKYEQALDCFNKAIEKKSDNGKAYRGRANSLGNLDRYEEAIADCESALKYMPNDKKTLERKTKFESKLKKLY